MTTINEISSSSVVESNTDILIQILLRLPVKSLLRFKSVSKRWLSLISDSYFIHNHCLQYRPSISGFFLSKSVHIKSSEFKFILVEKDAFGTSPGPSSVPFKTLNYLEGINIRQSCNGLFLCSTIVEFISDWSYTSTTTYYVYNPSTMNYKTIPPSPFRRHRSDAGCFVNLAFDPLKSPQYEVICICSNDSRQYQIDIYSSKTDSWRLAAGDGLFVVSEPMGIFCEPAIFWNGSLHWINLHWSSTGEALYFDVNRELLRPMPMPRLPDGRSTRRVKYFGVNMGHMHLIEMYPHRMGRFDILEMETDYRAWNVKYRLDLNDFITVHPDINWDHIGVSTFLEGYGFSILNFFDFDDKEEEGSSKLVLQMPGYKVFFYDIKEKSFMKIHDLVPSAHGSVLYKWSEAHLYIPTLARV